MICKRMIALLLLLGLLTGQAAALEPAQPYTAEDVQGCTVEELVNRFMEENYLTDGNFSLCYYNTVTGEEYCRNETQMMVAASTYKLPLNLYYYELVQSGELPADTIIYGRTLDQCHMESLVWSSNEVSEAMLYALGGFRIYKDCMRKYFTMTDEEIDLDYYAGNNYCTRMMMDTLKYLYENAEQFPEQLDYMKQAMPDAYFRKYCMDLEVAHKYGSYEGAENDTGIFYTEEPFLLAVYTKNAGDEIVSKAAALMRTYNEWRTEQDKLEAEQARQLRFEKRQAAEQRAAEEAAAREAFEASVREQKAQAEAAAAEVRARLETDVSKKADEQHQAEQEALRQQPIRSEPAEKQGIVFEWWMAAVALGVFGIGAVIASLSAKHFSGFMEELDKEDEDEEEKV